MVHATSPTDAVAREVLVSGRFDGLLRQHSDGRPTSRPATPHRPPRAPQHPGAGPAVTLCCSHGRIQANPRQPWRGMTGRWLSR